MGLKRQLKLVSPAVFLEEASPWKSFIIVVVAISAIFFLLLIWSAFATVNESADVFGQIAPQNKTEVIEHLDGGVIKQVNVKNGQTAKKGDVLLVMDSSRADAQLSQLLTRHIHLTFDEERLVALLNDTPLEKINWEPAFSNSWQVSADKKEALLQAEIQTFIKQKTHHQQRLETLAYQIKKYQTDIAKYQEQKKTMQDNLTLYRQELKMFKQLIVKKYVSKRDYIIVKRKTNTAEAELSETLSDLEYAKNQVKEYEARSLQQVATFKNELQQEIDGIRRQLSELQHQLTPLQAEVTRHTVKAMVDGVVTGLEVKRNSVVAADEKLLEIVPNTPYLEVNARLSTRDVGHVKVGDKAKIKILTYDYARYGDIDGVVSYIAANTSFTAQNMPYYEVHIKPKQTYVANNKKLKLKSGMTAQADIITGSKTILQYIISPIHNSLRSALGER